MKRASVDKYPVFRALGDQQEFLDSAAAETASRDERIRSIWPFIVRRSRQFYYTLKPRERVNFDPEDTLTELWVALAERDHKWEPAKGKYITFAGTIIDRELCAIRDKSRTVESPRNSSCRMKEYIKEEESGEISAGRLKTANDIRRTGDSAQSIGGDDGAVGLSDTGEGDPIDILTGLEVSRERLDAIKRAIRTLEPFEASVIGNLSGLWGLPQESVFWLAWKTGRDMSEIRQAKSSAIAKIRDYLLSIDHPITKQGD